MTVVLAGVGGDQENIGTNPPLYDDGTFEFIPIPEKKRQTDEDLTFGSWELRYPEKADASTAAEYIARRGYLNPDPEDHNGIQKLRAENEIADWPVHNDPNLTDLTYGEHRGSVDTRKKYVRYLSSLEAGDVVAFYSGLSTDQYPGIPRFLIGYMTVESAVSTESKSSDEVTSLLDRHPQNAHKKRAVDGQLYYEINGADDKSVVFVDGKEPGGLFDRDPIRITERKQPNKRANEYITEESFFHRFGSLDRNDEVYTARKPAVRLDISGGEFREAVGVSGER